MPEIMPSCTSDAAVRKLRELAEQYIRCHEDIAAEVGTENGGSALLIGEVCREVGSRLICVDGFSGNSYTGEPFDQVFFNRTRDRLRGLPISFLPMLSSDALDFIPDYTLSFCYIDGGHTHPVVDKDIVWYASKVCIGGVLCGHDYCKAHRPVMEAVDRIFRGEAKHEAELWYIEIDGRQYQG